MIFLRIICNHCCCHHFLQIRNTLNLTRNNFSSILTDFFILVGEKRLDSNTDSITFVVVYLLQRAGKSYARGRIR